MNLHKTAGCLFMVARNPRSSSTHNANSRKLKVGAWLSCRGDDPGLARGLNLLESQNRWRDVP